LESENVLLWNKHETVMVVKRKSY